MSDAALIAIGGFPGAGKTAISSRLAAEFHLPRLSSDEVGHALRASLRAQDAEIDAFRVGYDLIFRLGEDFIAAGVTAVLDMNLGWDFQWRCLDEITARHPQIAFAPIILRCPREICLARTQKRHQADPDGWQPASVYQSQQKVHAIWDYLQALDRPDVRHVDADGTEDRVYAAVRSCLAHLLPR